MAGGCATWRAACFRKNETSQRPSTTLTTSTPYDLPPCVFPLSSSLRCPPTRRPAFIFKVASTCTWLSPRPLILHRASGRWARRWVTRYTFLHEGRATTGATSGMAYRTYPWALVETAEMDRMPAPATLWFGSCIAVALLSYFMEVIYTPRSEP